MDREEIIRMALEALELLARYENPSTKIQVRKPKDGGPIVTMYPHKVATEAAALLRERLAQPEREWVGLTDEEKIELWNKHENHWRFEDNLMAFTRAIEAKLREKNHD